MSFQIPEFANMFIVALRKIFHKPSPVVFIGAGRVLAANEVILNTQQRTRGRGNVPHCTKWVIQFAFSAAVDLEITLDDATTWIDVNDELLAADLLYNFEIYIDERHTVNFRIPTAGGATIRSFTICEITERG